MKIFYTPEAINQLKEIKHYIAKELKNPKAAKTITEGITTDCKRLKDFPELGIEVNLADDGRPVRLLISGNYVVIYDREMDDIIIVAIEDARTNWISMIIPFREQIGE